MKWTDDMKRIATAVVALGSQIVLWGRCYGLF